MSKHVVIVGGGNLASGLSNMFSIYNDESKYTMSVYEPVVDNVSRISGSSHHDMSNSFRGFKTIIVESDAATLTSADIIIIAIPASAIKAFVRSNLDILKDSIIVDCSNPGRNDDDLRAVLEELGAAANVSWVKGFNDNGAIELINHKITSKKSVTTQICGPDDTVVAEVKRLAEVAMGFAVKIVPFSQYDAVAMNQNDLGKTWVHAAGIMMLVFSFATLYSIVRDHMTENVYGATLDWQYLPLYTANHSMAWTCIWGFALSQLPGVIARLYIMFGRYQLPNVLLWALNIRKEVGLISLFFLLCHAIMSVVIWIPGYFYWSYDDPTNPYSKFKWHIEASLFFGITGFGLYVVLGICSLPSVSGMMNSRQWTFVYGVVAWMALIFGLLHNLLLGKNIMYDDYYWPDKIPHQTNMSCSLPILVLGIKIIQVMMYPFNCKGKPKTPASTEDSLSVKEVDA